MSQEKRRAQKLAISMPAVMYDSALARAKRLQIPSFSEYIQWLIERDLKELPDYQIHRRDPMKTDQPPSVKYGKAAEESS